jgi:hypothetical protein
MAWLVKRVEHYRWADIAGSPLEVALREGWEPYAVTEDVVSGMTFHYLRRNEEAEVRWASLVREAATSDLLNLYKELGDS